MTLKEDNLSEGKSKRTSSRSKGKKELYNPEFKYLANLINLESSKWAKIGAGKLAEQFRSAKSEAKKQRIIEALNQAAIRAKHLEKSPALKPSEREQAREIREVYEDTSFNLRRKRGMFEVAVTEEYIFKKGRAKKIEKIVEQIPKAKTHDELDELVEQAKRLGVERQTKAGEYSLTDIENAAIGRGRDLPIEMPIRKEPIKPKSKDPLVRELMGKHRDDIQTARAKHTLSSDETAEVEQILRVLENEKATIAHVKDIEVAQTQLDSAVENYFKHIDTQPNWFLEKRKAIDKAMTPDKIKQVMSKIEDERQLFLAKRDTNYREVRQHENTYMKEVEAIAPINILITKSGSDLWSKVNAYARLSNARSRAQQEDHFNKELGHLRLRGQQRKIGARRERLEKRAKDTHPNDIIAFATDKQAFVILPNGFAVRTSASSKAQIVTNKSIENNLKKRKAVYLTKWDKVTKKEQIAIAFATLMGGNTETTEVGSAQRVVLPFPIPDDIQFKNPDGPYQNPKWIMDGQQISAIIINSEHQKPTCGKLKVPSHKMVKPDDPDLDESIMTIKTLQKSTKKQFSSSYHPKKLAKLVRFVETVDPNAYYGFQGRWPENNRPIIATSKEHGFQVMLAPRITRSAKQPKK